MSLGKGPGKALAPQGTRGPGPQRERDVCLGAAPGPLPWDPRGKGQMVLVLFSAHRAGTGLGTPRLEPGQPGDRCNGSL